MSGPDPKRRVNKARKRAAKKYMAEHGCSYQHAVQAADALRNTKPVSRHLIGLARNGKSQFFANIFTKAEQSNQRPLILASGYSSAKAMLDFLAGGRTTFLYPPDSREISYPILHLTQRMGRLNRHRHGSTVQQRTDGISS